ncbi:MAG TPA: discoidin domain-containing protein [Mycobacteriales bacterium]|nr:discoidin domain-containing protein [Mycobacteriales bacterium]
MMRRRWLFVGLVIAVVFAAFQATGSAGTNATGMTTVQIAGTDSGKTFDGVGAVSAGGSSRLLVDYPEPERSQILDYLFKPDYGASLQMLKVEIGGDIDSTDGAEPSHERSRGQLDCNLGYEYWLAKEAKKRNPRLKLYALAWGAPGWFSGGLWSQDYADYLVSWLGCAKSHGLDIDYLGGANERGYDRDFYIALRKTLDAHGYSKIKIVGTDEHHPPDYFTVAHDMKNDPEFADSIDILGEHDVCVWRTEQKHCNANDDARTSGKPLWDSENSTQDLDIGAAPLARVMNRHYLDVGITGNLNWALLAAWYDNFPIGGTGLLAAERPWSGYYEVGPEIWVDAQTTQFTQPGWRYLDGASGYLPGGASYVTLRSPTTGDYTTVVETMDATAPESVRFEVSGGLSTKPVQQWSSDLTTTTTADDFIHDRALPLQGGSFTATMQPGHVYTFSTTTGQHKATASSPADPRTQLALPYRQNFDRLHSGDLAPYVSDVFGGFQAEPCAGGRSGMCYQQMVTQQPITWGSGAIPPVTVVGDPRWWGDYQMSADALLRSPGYVELLGRVDSQQHNASGYHLQVADTGAWSLRTESPTGAVKTLASGTTDPIGVGRWHHLALRFTGERIAVQVDGQTLATVTDAAHTSGQVGLAVSKWQQAQFDNLQVTPTSKTPRFAPESGAVATSAETGNVSGHTYPARHAIDEHLWSMWRSTGPLPQALTVDLGSVRPIRGVAYTPGVTGGAAPITGYRIEVSTDGSHFRTAAEGDWQATEAVKTVGWDQALDARYVRLVATAASGCPAAATVAEFDVSTDPLPTLGAGDPGTNPDPTFPALVPQDQMSATATSAQDGYGPGQAIDGNCSTLWHTRFGAVDPPPQSITLDLGKAYDTVGLAYQPRQDGNGNGVISRYTVELSTDGTTFTPAADGSWASDSTIKAARWSATPARYVRLTGVEGGGNFVSAAEINVGYQP